MSTHNIVFYEDLTKLIFELSSNFIKYAPYFFCWSYRESVNLTILDLDMPFSQVTSTYCTPKTYNFYSYEPCLCIGAKPFPGK